MARQQHDQDTVRRYLLKRLSDAEQQAIALRILSDDDFSSELEIAENELIDEYVTQELSKNDRIRFEQEFLTTPERLGKLKSAQILKRYFDRFKPDPPPKPSRFWPKWPELSFFPGGGSVAVLSPPVVMAMTLLLIAVAGLIIWRVAFYTSDLQKGLLALNEAYRQERPIEARVSTLDYARFVSTRNNEPKPVNTFELERAKQFLYNAEKYQADAASAHAMGKLHLLQKEYDKAIEYLERAAKTDSKNAQIYADLGAAYLEKGRFELDASKSKEPNLQTGKGLADLGRSLEYLKQSLELDPTLLEALFNRGLVHQGQGLYQEAEKDWRAYLERDSTSEWAVDAREKLRQLEEDKNSRGSQDTKGDFNLEPFMRAYHADDETAAWKFYKRNYAGTSNPVIKALIDKILANDTESSANLQALHYLGQLEARDAAADPYISDLAKVYASATPQTRPLLLQARQEIKKAAELITEFRLTEAAELFATAQKTFDQVGDVPESLSAGVAIAHIAAVEPDLEKGQEVVAHLVRTCEERQYKWLLAQVLIKRAHIRSNLDNYSDAINDSQKALQIFQDFNDLSNTLLAFSQLANVNLLVNDHETSFSFLRKAMTIGEEQGASPIQLWPLYTAASLNLSSLKLYRAALDYQQEALDIALSSGSPVYISRSYQNIGLTYAALGQLDLAFENVRRAYGQGKPLETKRNGKNMMASASLRLGDLYRTSGDLTNALAAYDESSRLYESLEFDHYSYAAHKGKFLSYLAQNNDALAAQELPIVLNLMEKTRGKIPDDRQTSYFFAKEQDICALAIDFTYFRLGDQYRALDYSEICRARSLYQLMKQGAKVTSGASGLDLRTSQPEQSGNALPLTGTEIKQQIPEEVQIVQYAVLEKKLVMWWITRSEIVPRFIDVESSTLEKIVTTTRQQIKQRDDKGSADSLKRLYDLLIAPVSSQLDPNKVLCFIPDETLHFVPFGALMSTTSGRYLAEDYRLMTSSSASILIESTNRAQARSSVPEERLLAVGNPTFDSTANPNLANLASAEHEVQEIMQGYQIQKVLIGGQATRKSVEDQLPRAQVAHFAAHYQIDAQSPLSSRVLLSPEPGDRAHAQISGLRSADIYQMDLTQTRLVVLSACQTGIEQQIGGEGPIGFARSFLVAGVPVVVASLWPVDSEATTELMILFHRYRRSDHSTSEALTRAQREVMTREKYRHPYYWAGFTAIGGYSEF